MSKNSNPVGPNFLNLNLSRYTYFDKRCRQKTYMTLEIRGTEFGRVSLQFNFSSEKVQSTFLPEFWTEL